MNNFAPGPSPRESEPAGPAPVYAANASSLPLKHRVHDLDRAPGMRRQQTAATDQVGVHFIGGLVGKDLRWIFRDQPIEDYGIDAHMEVVTDDARVTGRLVGLQIKSGQSYFKEVERSKTEPGWNFYANSAHLAYWLQHSLPVIVVINDPGSSEAYFQVVRQDLIEETGKGFNLYVPESNRFDATAKQRILDFVAGWRDLESSLDGALTLLPPNCASVLRRAAEVDRPVTARLADALSAGRATPDFTAAALIAAQPTWIVTSPAEQDLWLSIGNYCSAHGYQRVAADAFWLGSESEGARTSRALAVTGLCLLPFDREAARPFLEEARRRGQVLLADVGLAAVDTPLDDARVLDIPQSITDASDLEISAEPTVLNFLAEMALRNGKLADAIAYRERALASGGEPDPAISLMLAQTIWRRAREEGGHFASAKRRALALTSQAIEECRRWDGPSAEALVVHLDIQLTAGFNEDAVRSASPATRGGTAQPNEATDPAVARRGAIAAMATGNAEAFEYFTDLLIGASAIQREIEALQADAATGDSADHRDAAVGRWRAVLEEATDDEMRARAVSRLVSLGDWPPQADDLIDRSILPKSQAAILRASYRVQSAPNDGELRVGLAQLRELARANTMAALMLVTLLAANDNLAGAIDECEKQVRRWNDPALVQLLFDLYRRIGDQDRAAVVAGQHVDDESLPLEIRQQMCGAQVTLLFRKNRLSEAISAAQRGLAIGPDPDLAWNLVTMLANTGNLSRAREELARYRPEPTTDQETRLWLDLHLGAPLPPADARTMLGIAEQHSSSMLGQNVMRLLAREVLVNADAVAYPTALVDEVERLLEAHAALRDAPRDFSDELARTFFSSGPLTQAGYKEMISDIRAGRASHHDAARALSQPYGWALIQHVSGVQVAFDLEPPIRAVGTRSASEALGSSHCVVDLSALRTLSLLPDDLRALIRDHLTSIKTTADTARDATKTREIMRGLRAASSVLTVSDSGETTRVVVEAADHLVLANAAAALEAEVSLTETEASQGDSLLEQIITQAREERRPVWCDESHSRQVLRRGGIACFSTLDLLEALTDAGLPVDAAACMFALGSNRLADLPLSAAVIVAIAEHEGWKVGSANVAISRASWWMPGLRRPFPRLVAGDQAPAWAPTWEADWSDVAFAAARHSYDAVLVLTGAALVGICQSVSPSLRTQACQQLVVSTLRACHHAGRDASKLLWGLSQDGSNGAIAPNPVHVMMSLAAALRADGVDDAEAVAWNLAGQPQNFAP